MPELLILLFLILLMLIGIFAIIARRAARRSAIRRCPFCAEFVRSEAVVCKHCGRDIPGSQRAT
jgi:hypothetical protein